MYVDIKKSEGKLIRIEAKEYEGHEYLDIRTMLLDAQDQWRYTQRGVTFRPDQINELIEAIKEASKDIKKQEKKDG